MAYLSNNSISQTIASVISKEFGTSGTKEEIICQDIAEGKRMSERFPFYPLVTS